MTINENPSGLPEQEPTSPTAAVLCDGETWAKTGADWESPREIRAWGDLRDLAAERGGATLFDLADLPTGLTEVQKEAVRSIESKFLARGIVYLVVTLFLIGVFLDELEEAALPVALFWPLSMWVFAGLWLANRHYERDNR